MPLFDYDAVNFPGIKIEDTGGASTYVLTVREALNHIVAQPVGHRMLTEIIAHAPVFATWNAKIKILRPAGKVVDITNPGSEGGSKCAACSNGNAMNGTGSASGVYWNPNIFVVPERGYRPPFIGLAHELVHAWHNALGTKKGNYDEEESFTVGIGIYAVADPHSITENKIRLEHNVPIRHKY